MNVKQSEIVAMISGALSGHGVWKVVGSPGSRNLPLLAAFKANGGLRVDMVVDERSASFSALGVADVSRQPVAICCTSGTAVLNYAPALAEAMARRVPLLAITADRPADALSCGEQQTIDQINALTAVTSAQVDILDSDSLDEASRKMAQVLHALDKGWPVQLNVRLSEPLSLVDTLDVEMDGVSMLSVSEPQPSFTTGEVRRMSCELASPAKVLIYVGGQSPDNRLTEAIRRLAKKPNVVVVADLTANLYDCKEVIYGVERYLDHLSAPMAKDLTPDVLITLGMSPIGRRFRNFIKEHFCGVVWLVGECPTVNYYDRPVNAIKCDAAHFMRQLASAMVIHAAASDYAARWHRLAQSPLHGDQLVMERILRSIPRHCNVALSNGLVVRYANLMRPVHHRYIANRGVNGIDGTTSTAIGGAAAYSGMTVLVTGDMSACYDMSAWCNPMITPRFRAVVVDNGGGGIFRRIEPSRSFSAVEELACCSALIPPLQSIVGQCGFETMEVTTAEADIEHAIGWVTDESDRPRLLIVKI